MSWIATFLGSNNVPMVARYSGCKAREQKTSVPRLMRKPINAASATALAPSYKEAFDTSIPVNFVM
jgi:hypothetical protein